MGKREKEKRRRRRGGGGEEKEEERGRKKGKKCERRMIQVHKYSKKDYQYSVSWTCLIVLICTYVCVCVVWMRYIGMMRGAVSTAASIGRSTLFLRLSILLSIYLPPC
jgi:hypothetical protein